MTFTKTILLAATLLLTPLCVNADDGNTTTINAAKVARMTFDGDQVTISYNDGTPSATFDMAEVIIDFSNTTSIDERVRIATQQGLEGKPIYTLAGQYVGRSVATLRTGTYVVEGKKIIVR